MRNALRTIHLPSIIALIMLTFGAIKPLQAAELDWLVTYDEGSRKLFNGDPHTAMQNWTTQINQIFINSQVDIKLRLLGAFPLKPEATDSHAVLDEIRGSPSVERMRDQLGADLVTQLFVGGECSAGYWSLSAQWAYSVVDPNCGVHAAAHAMGHNMGLGHSRHRLEGSFSFLPYALGYGVDNLFVTVMADSSIYGNATRESLFSNPYRDCRGLPCGVMAGTNDQAFAAKALQTVRRHVENFRPRRSLSSVVRLQKSGSNFALDGNWGAANWQKVYLWRGDYNNFNQHWVEMDLGSGFVAYRKNHSKHCIDGDRGGRNGQLVVLWECSKDRHSQHWRKIRLKDGTYRLEKRDAPEFSLDGGDGARNYQQLRLWESDDKNTNQQWRLNY